MISKVIPSNFTDELEELDAVGISEMSITYTQPADTCSPVDCVQSLKITTQYACSSTEEEANNQEAFYFDISIPDGHWSVDDGDSLKALVDDFKKRLYMKTELKENNNK